MNPYASYLGDQDPVRVLGETPARLQRMVASIGDARANTAPAPGKWSPREIVSHLADCEIVFAFRYRQALSEDNHTIQPFDQDNWAKSYGAFGIEQALAVFTKLREWNLSLIRSLSAEQMTRVVTHPERGKMLLGTIVETAAGHDINHLRQLEAAAKHAA